jgi:lysophospholipase-2
MMSDHAKKLPIFMAHGTADPVISFEHGRGSYLYMRDKLGLLEVEAGKVC